MTNTWNVGCIGYGLSTKIFQIPFIQKVPELNLYAVVQRTPKPNDDAEKDHPGIKSYRSVEEMLKDPKVDIVIVSTTPTTHFDFTKQALESGKHVVVEKPFVPTSKEAQELDRLAKEKGKLLAVFQNRRWDSDFLTLKKILESGQLGRVVEFETHFDRHRPVADLSRWQAQPAPGVSVVYDLGTHLMDQVISLYGMPKRVTGFVSAVREGNDIGFDDACTILLHYEGMMVSVKAQVVSPEVEQLRYWVRGTKGSFKKFRLDVQEDQLKAGLRPGQEGYGVDPESAFGTLTTLQADGSFKKETYPTVPPATYTGFYTEIVKALKGEGPVPVSATDGANVIRLCELARQSSAEGKTLDV